MTLPSGEEIYQSDAMLRWAGSLGNSALYPNDSAIRLKIDAAIGLCSDLDRAWRPAIYMGMKPEAYGHCELTDEAKVKIILSLLLVIIPARLLGFEGWMGWMMVLDRMSGFGKVGNIPTYGVLRL